MFKFMLRYQPITIDRQATEMAGSFKHLEMILNTSLNFKEHLGYIFKTAMQRLFPSVVYTSLEESMISNITACWFGNAGASSKNKFTKIMNTVSKIERNPQRQLVELHITHTRRKTTLIFQDCDLDNCLTVFFFLYEKLSVYR